MHIESVNELYIDYVQAVSLHALARDSKSELIESIHKEICNSKLFSFNVARNKSIDI